VVLRPGYGQAPRLPEYSPRKIAPRFASQGLPNDELYEALLIQTEALFAAGIVSVNAIGDCLAPGTIAAAVYAGHRYAREFDFPEIDQVGFRREMPL
jgi:hypothetical protein